MVRIQKNNGGQHAEIFLALFSLTVLSKWLCLAGSVTHYLSPQLTDKACGPDDRVFEMSTPSQIGCAYLCMTLRACVAISYDELEKICIGCRCSALRKDVDSSQEGTKLFVRETASMFNGRCGSVRYVTAEYEDDSLDVTDAIQMRANRTWAPDSEQSYLLKIKFGYPRLVYSISTLGRRNNEVMEYVTRYSVYISYDCTSKKQWIKTLDGNQNSYNAKMNTFTPPVLTKCLFLEILEWRNYPFLQLGLVGY